MKVTPAYVDGGTRSSNGSCRDKGRLPRSGSRCGLGGCVQSSIELRHKPLPVVVQKLPNPRRRPGPHNQPRMMMLAQPVHHLRRVIRPHVGPLLPRQADQAARILLARRRHLVLGCPRSARTPAAPTPPTGSPRSPPRSPPRYTRRPPAPRSPGSKTSHRHARE